MSIFELRQALKTERENSLRAEGRAEVQREMHRALMAGMPAPNQQMMTVPMSYPQTGPSPYPLYALDTPITFATPQSPRRRPGSFVDVYTLRQFADTYDILRDVINHLKREVSAVKGTIVSRDRKDDSTSTAQRIVEATEFFGINGGLGGRGRRRAHFEGEIIEDTCIVGACAIYYSPSLGGRPYEAIAIDAATIRPRVDAYGWPGPNDAWYEQWIQGMLIRGFTLEELTYDGLFPVTYSPYFKSPVEWLILCIMSALKADEWNRTWLTDGTTPSDLLALPDNWSVEQIQTFTEWFNSLLAGNTRARQQTRFVPSGTQKVNDTSRKDQEFQEFELWLMRRTCSMFGVQPASIGFAGEQYKVSQDGSMESTTQFGAGALLDFRKDQYDLILERLGFPDLEFSNTGDAEEDVLLRAQRLAIAVGNKAWISVNEARKAEGLDPVSDGDEVIAPDPEPGPANSNPDDRQQEAGRWQRKALKALKETGSAGCPFSTSAFTAVEGHLINAELLRCTTPEQVKTFFSSIANETQS